MNDKLTSVIRDYNNAFYKLDRLWAKFEAVGDQVNKADIRAFEQKSEEYNSLVNKFADEFKSIVGSEINNTPFIIYENKNWEWDQFEKNPPYETAKFKNLEIASQSTLF